MQLSGVLPPIATPFRDGNLDTTALAANAARWMTTGLAGLVVLGSNGEAPLVDEDEAVRAIATVRERVPSERALIAGTGRESTIATIGATRRAAAAGADAVLVRTPAFFKSQMTADAFAGHFSAVADASPVPVLLYNVTIFTGVNLTPDAVARVADHPNIIGIKESGGDIAQIGELVARTPEEFLVLAGSAPTFYAALCVGADGGVLAVACVVPDLCVRLYELFQAGRHDEARELQRLLTPLARLVTSVYGVPGLKAALNLAGYPSGEPRPPLGLAPAAAVELIRTELAVLEQATAGTSLTVDR